jgi:hypothetical protein
MEPPISPLVFIILLFLGMQSLLEAGRRLGVRHSKEGQTERSGLSAVESAVFALFGLMIAFIFSGAASRFNEKRMLIAEEVNALETAYLRVQLVSPAEPIPLEALIRRYLDSRLETYRTLPDMQAAELEMANSRKLQKEISLLRGRWLCNFIPHESFMHFYSVWGSSVPFWLVIGWGAANSGVGCTSSGLL